MSPINFDALIDKYPEREHALRTLEKWMRAHGDAQVINPMTLAKEVRGIDPSDLASALTVLVTVGLLRRVYKVLTPSGVFAEGEFDDPTKIPEKLPDRWEHYFDTADSDVIPVFKKVA
jgi:hypothetical protein